MVTPGHLQPDLKASNTTLCQGCRKRNEATKAEVWGEAWNLSLPLQNEIEQLFHYLIYSTSSLHWCLTETPGSSPLLPPGPSKAHPAQPLISCRYTAPIGEWRQRVGGQGGRRKDQCTDLSVVPFICFHRMWNTVFARMQDSPYIKETGKGKIFPLSLQRNKFTAFNIKKICIWADSI